jgi:hypothetical protein
LKPVDVGVKSQPSSADRHGSSRAPDLATGALRRNRTNAQEDCDCMVAPEWQKIFETNAVEMLRGL